MPKRTDLKTILLIGSGPDRHRAGRRVRLLGHAGGARPQGGGLPGRPRQFESRHDHDGPRAGRRHLHRAGHARVGGQGDRARAPGRPAAHDGRTDGAQCGDGAPARRHAREVRRRADRRQRAGHPPRRRSRGIRPCHAADRPRHAAGPDGPEPGGGARGGRGHRLSRHPPALLHAGRHRRGHRLQPRGIRDAHPPGARALAGGLGAGGAERHRLEGVRARGDARRGGQRRDRLLDREPRPDGRAHRRLDHRRPGHDAHRPRVPGDAGRVDPDHPRDRRGGGRLQHPVRGGPRPRASSSSSR